MSLIETNIVLLLLIAAGVGLAAKWLRWPYTVVLVLAGLVVGASGKFAAIPISQDVLLLVFLPPLLFEGCLNVDLATLRDKWLDVFLLAVPGTAISIAIIGTGLHYLLDMSWVLSLLLGTIISPTDPVSVLAMFKELGVNKKLATVVEGESVFNDGLGVVIFLVLLKLASGHEMSVGDVGALLGKEVVGGAVVGILCGYLVHRLLGRIEDHLIEVMISVITAFGAYLLAYHLHFSGVIAVVLAGIILGNFGQTLSMSPTTRITLNSFWEVVAYIVNSLVFLLVGLNINLPKLTAHAGEIAVVIGLFLVARAALILACSGALRLFGKPWGPGWMPVVAWSGLRGTIPIALVLGLTPDIDGGQATIDRFVAITFGVVLFSLVVQGMSIKWFLDRFGFTTLADHERDYETTLGKAVALKAARSELAEMSGAGELSAAINDRLATVIETNLARFDGRLHELMESQDLLAAQQEHRVSRRLLLAQRSALEGAFQRGLLSEHIANELKRNINARLIEESSAEFSDRDSGPEVWLETD